MAVNGPVVRVTIGDDREQRRAELRWALQAAGASVVAEAVTPADLLRLSLRHQPDLVVVDPTLGGETSNGLVARLLAGVPDSHVVSSELSPRPARVGDRLHVVRGLAPGHVATLLRCLTWSAAEPAGTAVVCIADPTFRAAVTAVLGDDRIATLEEVRGAAEAHRAVEDLRPDLLIMDLSLTGIGGWRYLKELSEDHPTCRVIVTSPLGSAPLAVREVGVSEVVAEGDIAGLRAAVRSLPVGGQASGTGIGAAVLDVSDGSRMVNPASS